jgi:hypothetical protein
MSGHGQLTVVNDTYRDAVVDVLVPETDSLVRSVYITANSSWTIRKLSPGSYIVIFATGQDWDDEAQDFTQDNEYAELSKRLVFHESSADGEIHYIQQRVTLQPVLFGNVPKTDIERARFQRAMSQRMPPVPAE